MNPEKSTQPFKLPVHPLHNPLTEDDLKALHALEEKLNIAIDMVYRAQGLVSDVESRIERAEMHKAVHQTLMERYFPAHLPATHE